MYCTSAVHVELFVHCLAPRLKNVIMNHHPELLNCCERPRKLVQCVELVQEAPTASVTLGTN